MLVAPERDGSLGLQPQLRDRMEHILDARSLSRLRTSVAGDSVLAMSQVVAARKLVSLSGRAAEFDRQRRDRAQRARDDV